MTTSSLEHLATLEPDVIVTYEFWVGEIGEEVLTELAELVIIPDGLTTAEHILAVGDLMGRADAAEEVAGRLQTATEDAAAVVGNDCDVSLATIYSDCRDRGQPALAAATRGAADNVAAIDRLGYPGAEGQIRFLAEFGPMMADDDLDDVGD